MRVVVSESVYCERIGDEVVLLDVASGLYFGLEPVGSRLWELLRELGDTSQVVDRALEEFAVERERLTADLDQLIAELVKQGLLERDDCQSR